MQLYVKLYVFPRAVPVPWISACVLLLYYYLVQLYVQLPSVVQNQYILRHTRSVYYGLHIKIYMGLYACRH